MPSMRSEAPASSTVCADSREKPEERQDTGKEAKSSRNWQGEWPKTPGRLLGIGSIRLYQLTLSPLIGRSCRHLPTCSEYGYEAIARHGVLAGSWLTLWRVLKCNPLGTSGIDPVPEKMKWFPRK